MTVQEVLRYLEKRGSKRNVDGMARFGIVAMKVFGVSVETLRTLGKKTGRDHALALALWKSGWYEARMLCAFVDEPAKVTPTQIERSLRLIARAAKDERNFVKKGVSWALRSIGSRSPQLNRAAIQLATNLAKSSNSAERWVGKDALRDLTRPLVQKKISARERTRSLRSR
jgi:3-methyladenine DNA glycosylase AlkD